MQNVNEVYVTNLEGVVESGQEQTYELHRVADWLAVIAEEMRYANAMTRLTLEGGSVAKLREQGY